MQVDLEQWDKTAIATIEAIETIAKSLQGKEGWTGKEDCDSCPDLLLSNAIDIFKAIHAKFELIPKEIKGQDK